MNLIKYSFLFLLFNSLNILGQINYYKTDSLTRAGIKLVDGGENSNSRNCRIENSGEYINYSPSIVKEYGFRDGRIFFSRKIKLNDSTQIVFLERLVHGKISLYYYKSKGIKTYYLERADSILVELPRRTKENNKFTRQLDDFTSDLPRFYESARLAAYTKSSLSLVIKRYNSNDLRPIPAFKYGFQFSFELSNLILHPNFENPYIKDLKLHMEGSFNFGLFIQNPLITSNIFIHTELYYSRHGYSYTGQVNNSLSEFVANTSALNLPILIRYTYPSGKIKPFFNYGIHLVYNMKHNSTFYQTNIYPGRIEINDLSLTTPLPKYEGGYILGSGIEYKLNYRKSSFAELRYAKLLPILNASSPENSMFQLIIGMNF